jgi:tellurite resistance protein
MHEQDRAIVTALVSVAWADGHFEAREREMLEALLDAFGATPEEKSALLDYAKERRTLDDVPLTELSADDRRLVLEHATTLTFVDGEQDAEERELLKALAGLLRIPNEEATSIVTRASERARSHLDDLAT